MFKYLPIISIVCLLQAFKATQPEPFQKDRTPEDRTEYNGLTGMVQQQKDQNYLMSKELSDKCNEAKIDLAIAESEGNLSEIKENKKTISKMCI